MQVPIAGDINRPFVVGDINRPFVVGDREERVKGGNSYINESESLKAQLSAVISTSVTIVFTRTYDTDSLTERAVSFPENEIFAQTLPVITGEFGAQSKGLKHSDCGMNASGKRNLSSNE
ncbi:hypothetical protein STEG23_020353, partial [Scotinomys teguina]